MTPRLRLPVHVAGILALVTVIVLGLVAIRHAMRSAGHSAPDGWYYSRFVVHAPDGGKAPAILRKAVQRVETSRLEAMGVRQVWVRMTGDGFVLAVAPDTRSLLAALTDALPVVEFRPVIAVTKPDGKCAPDRSSSVGWTVLIGLNGPGTARFEAFTECLAKEPAPRNSLAIAVDGSVISAPAVQAKIPGGLLEIAGSYTQSEATRLAAPFQVAAARVRVEHGPITDTP